MALLRVGRSFTSNIFRLFGKGYKYGYAMFANICTASALRPFISVAAKYVAKTGPILFGCYFRTAPNLRRTACD